jgi:predicted metal-dependent phosphoesterase TrpH
MLRVEFHCHTTYSKDSLLAPRDLLARCVLAGIDRVVVTDHNGIEGALAARALDPERVIVGEEIMTTQGELLAAFLKTRVAPGLTPRETIARLRDQGAFVSVAHPFDHWRKGGWNEQDLMAIVPFVDAIEVYNSRCMRPADNQSALAFGQRHNLAGTVGSDAHTAWEVGRSVLLLSRFESADELRAIIRQGRAQTRWSPPWIHLSSRYARWRKQMAAGLDTPRPA